MMMAALTTARIKPVVADGGFCFLCDWLPLKEKIPTSRTALDFIMQIIEEVGVLGWLLTLFYGDEHKYITENYIRFSYHKVYARLDFLFIYLFC